MNILLTNDDGYASEGLQSLYQKLSEYNNVFICAPLGERSASGHAVTLSRRMRYISIDGGYALDGTPADCVKTALHGFFKSTAFDLVVSGINRGANLGTDIFYSGTVGAAREGVINGLTSLAVSIVMDKYNASSVVIASAYLDSFVRKLSGIIQKTNDILFNINFPGESFNSVVQTSLATKYYKDIIHFENEPGHDYALLKMDFKSYIEEKGTDIDAIIKGNASVTALKYKSMLNSHDKIPDIMEKIL